MFFSKVFFHATRMVERRYRRRRESGTACAAAAPSAGGSGRRRRTNGVKQRDKEKSDGHGNDGHGGWGPGPVFWYATELGFLSRRVVPGKRGKRSGQPPRRYHRPQRPASVGRRATATAAITGETRRPDRDLGVVVCPKFPTSLLSAVDISCAAAAGYSRLRSGRDARCGAAHKKKKLRVTV